MKIPSLIVRLVHADGGVVATLNLDDANAADVCTRCSEIPWTNVPERFMTWTNSFSSTCRICRLLKSCTPYDHEDEVKDRPGPGTLFTRDVTPMKLEGQLEELNFQHSSFTMQGAFAGRFFASKIFVSDLSPEQAELALRPLSIPRVMSLALMGDHFRDCVANHSHTCASEDDRYPLHLRVIDCNTRTVVDAPAHCDFVALSYVWGGVCAVQEAGITQDIPLTVKHSIYVTVKLGFRYLWIDRYVSVIVYYHEQH